MSNDVFALRNVDYSEKGAELEIVIEGQGKRQTVIYAGVDYQGEKWYYTQEGHQYILDARRGRVSQRFVIDYLDKIPVIIRQPVATGRDVRYKENYLYFGEIPVAERGYKKELFVVLMKKTNINVVWNFYWLEDGKIPHSLDVLYRTRRARKYLRGR
jgi:hypothetical protein